VVDTDAGSNGVTGSGFESRGEEKYELIKKEVFLALKTVEKSCATSYHRRHNTTKGKLQDLKKYLGFWQCKIWIRLNRRSTAFLETNLDL